MMYFDSQRGRQCLPALLLLLAPSCAVAAGDILYLDLVAPVKAKPKLPYGQSFTIRGKTGDVCRGGKTTRTDNGEAQCSGPKLTDQIAPDTVGGKYTVDGKDTPFNPQPVAGGAWKVIVGELKENSAVTFTFSFSGKPSQDLAEKIVNEVLEAPSFKVSLDQYVAEALGKRANEQAAPSAAFGQTVAGLVTAALAKEELSPKDAPTFGELLANVPTDVSTLRELGAERLKSLGVTASMSPSELYDALKAPLQDAVMANLTVEVGSSETNVTKDLLKYGGFDLGAMYSPRLGELRSFATASIYFKPVEMKTEDSDQPWFIQRVSVTFGVALKDVSGGDPAKSKIKGQNAFIYGLGVRINKYFRVTIGGMLYRATLPAINGVASPITNRLRSEFFIGPSIDVTALPALKSIFAKAKSD